MEPFSKKRPREEVGSPVGHGIQALLSSEKRSSVETKQWLRSLSRAERRLVKDPGIRLSRLAALRVRCQAEGREVGDDELFERGELEALMRSEQEVEILRKANGWEMSHDMSQTRQDAILGGPHVNGIPAAEERTTSCAGEVEEVVEEWRPLSPTMMSATFLPEDFDDW